jgi:hypothetical protein
VIAKDEKSKVKIVLYNNNFSDVESCTWPAWVMAAKHIRRR